MSENQEYVPPGWRRVLLKDKIVFLTDGEPGIQIQSPAKLRYYRVMKGRFTEDCYSPHLLNFSKGLKKSSKNPKISNSQAVTLQVNDTETTMEENVEEVNSDGDTYVKVVKHAEERKLEEATELFYVGADQGPNHESSINEAVKVVEQIKVKLKSTIVNFDLEDLKRKVSSVQSCEEFCSTVCEVTEITQYLDMLRHAKSLGIRVFHYFIPLRIKMFPY